MSIALLLAQTRPADVPTGVSVLILLLGLTVLSLGLIAWLAVRRPLRRPVVRFGPYDSALHFLLMTVAAGVAMMLLTSALRPVAPFQGQARDMSAGAIAELLAFVGLLALNAQSRPDGTRLLGVEPRRAGAGLLRGLIGVLIVLPWILWVTVILTALVKEARPEVETDHPLFHTWQENPGWSFGLSAAFIAVVVAPLFEELFFRGIVQTGLARLFTPSRRDLRSFPVVPPQPVGQPPLSDAVRVFVPLPATAPRVTTPASRWAAIIGASVLFALMHWPPLQMAPIFLLSLALGWLYERTGNLWAVIFMHMFFNGFMFSLFVLLR